MLITSALRSKNTLQPKLLLILNISSLTGVEFIRLDQCFIPILLIVINIAVQTFSKVL